MLALHLAFTGRFTPFPPSFAAPYDLAKTNMLKQSDFAIFYHIYIPVNRESQQNALRIVEEQLQQLGNSYATKFRLESSPESLPTRLFYNTIGARDVVDTAYMDPLCLQNNLECHHLEHYDESMEKPTLHRVYDYCRDPIQYGNDFEDDEDLSKDVRRVVYLHNKGSFHIHDLNERWRRLMTYAVSSKECLHPPDNSCNLCGLFFAAERGLFMPGNFWTARCDYIARLTPPLDYEEKATMIMKDALLLHLQHQFDMDLFNFIPDNYGVLRYADEMWSASHPSVQPCDLSYGKKSTFGFGHSDPFFVWLLGQKDPFQRTQQTLQWSMAPSAPIDLPLSLREDGLHSWFFEPAKRIREFVLLGGNLYKWIKLYQEIPPPRSWIWAWFPDGDTWQSAISKYGLQDAVEKLTEDNKLNQVEYIDPIYKLGYKRLRWFHRWPFRYLGICD